MTSSVYEKLKVFSWIKNDPDDLESDPENVPAGRREEEIMLDQEKSRASNAYGRISLLTQPRISKLLEGGLWARPGQPEDLQALRDEVRQMATNGRPANGIPTYKGRRAGDGAPIPFLFQHYARYLPRDKVPTLFMHDLREIDPTLARAVENESRGRALPIGTKSTLLTLLAEGHYTDGPSTKKRVREALRHRAKM